MSFLRPQVLCLFLAVLAFPVMVFAQFHPVERVSVNQNGNDIDGNSTSAQISSSADGRYVVFASDGANIVSGDTNGVTDIFLYDRTDDTVMRLSVSSTETQSNAASRNPVISADGAFIAFESDATNLVDGDTNSATDIFLYDTSDDSVTRISVQTDGDQVNGNSTYPSINSDGQFVAFQSDATNLVTSDNNSSTDIFLRDTDADTTTRISLDSDEEELNGASSRASINGDGTLIAFQSDATDAVLSDSNDVTDVFLRNTTAGTTVLASKDADGDEGNGQSTHPAISSDGTCIAFQSDATNLVDGDSNALTDIFAYDVGGDSVSKVTNDSGTDDDTDGSSMRPSISSTGRYIAFQSSATDLVDGDSNDAMDVFVVDMDDSATVRVSVEQDGDQILISSSAPSINSDGHYVAFQSSSENYVSGDSNESVDIFVIDTQCLVEPDGITPLDTDSDGTDDCGDACPEDATKTAVGICGCGTADTDTDGDGSADCVDACPSDADKTTAGECGCGESEADANSNGVADCLDPDTDTRPRKPVVRNLKKKNRLKVIIPEAYPGFRYQIVVMKDGKRILRRNTSRTRARLAGLSGRVQVKYRIILGSKSFSKFSRSAKITAR